VRTPKLIPQGLLDDILYDLTSPTGLRWKAYRRGLQRDLVAGGSSHPRGYCPFTYMGRKYLAHRVVWALHYGDPGDLVVDHINGDTSDNRIENLQAITEDQNNKRIVGKGCRKRQDTGKWEALSAGYGYKNLGCFDTEEEAHAAYLADKAAQVEGLQVTL